MMDSDKGEPRKLPFVVDAKRPFFPPEEEAFCRF